MQKLTKAQHHRVIKKMSITLHWEDGAVPDTTIECSSIGKAKLVNAIIRKLAWVSKK